jgi:uncharacterized membrane protein YphA (DoxX/SURF4 family)
MLDLAMGICVMVGAFTLFCCIVMAGILMRDMTRYTKGSK